MKKFITPSLFFVFTFFLFSSNILALTRSFTVNSNQFSLVNTSEFRDLLDFVSSNPVDSGVTNYIIYIENNTYYIYYSPQNYIFPIYFYNYQNPSVPHFAWGTLQYVGNQYVNAKICTINTSPFSYSNCFFTGSSYQHFIEVNETTLVIDYSTFLYSSYDLNYPGGTTFEINLNDYTYTFTTNEHLPSLYEYYNLYHSNTDDYPMLTSFYSIFINKLTLLCNYITENYIILSIFVILIFYYTILILRRLK